MLAPALILLFAIWVGSSLAFAAWRSGSLERKTGVRRVVADDWAVRLFVSASSLVALALVVILMTHQDSLA